MYVYNKFILWGKFFPFFQFLCCIQRKLGRKDFPMEQFPIDSFMLLCKQKNFISINQQIFNQFDGNFNKKS